MEPELDTLDEVENLKAGLVARAVGESGIDYAEYLRIRKLLLANESIKHLLPKFVQRHRSPDEFWNFIQPKFKTYRERRGYLQDEFESLLTFLEGRANSPGDVVIDDTLQAVDSDHIHAA